MPRRPRVVVANYPHHLVQRGHNRQVVFARDDDYRYYLATVRTWKEALGCRIYAYCLMTNHVHIVIDPGDQPKNLAIFMKRVAARQTRHVNCRQGRSGTLWEGRYKSSPIDTDGYLLACCRYVEMNPVRAGIVDTPEKYPWSSSRFRIAGEDSGLLDHFPGVILGAGSSRPGGAWYRAWLRSLVPDGEWDRIRDAVQRCQLTGGDGFKEKIERSAGWRVESRGPGRPRKGSSVAP